MASRLWSGTVKNSPAAAGGYGFSDRSQPLHGGNTCRFGSKRPVSNHPLRASSRLFCSSASSSTVVGANRTLPAPSPPSDLDASPVPLLLVPQILLDKDEYQLGNDVTDDRYVFYSLPEEKILTVEKNRIGDDARWVGSSKGWIMYMSRRDCNLYLYNPLSSSFVALPSLETLPSISGRHHPSSETDETDDSPWQSRIYESILSSIEPDFKFIMHDWYWASFKDIDKHVREMNGLPRNVLPILASPEDLVNRGFISKMVLSSDPTSSSNSYAAIVYGSTSKLAICRVGDKRWTQIKGSHYKEIYFSRHDNSKLFVSSWITNTNFGLLSMKKLPSNKTGRSRGKIISPDWEVIPETKVENGFVFLCLVESATDAGHLLMVRKSLKNGVMDVHKLNLLDADKKWERVESLDDQALFVGEYSEALVVPATQLPAQVKPNCIYFTNFESGQVGVFKLEERAEKFEAFDDGICLDLSLRSKENDFSHMWKERFRKAAEGWPVWVTPNLR